MYASAFSGNAVPPEHLPLWGRLGSRAPTGQDIRLCHTACPEGGPLGPEPASSCLTDIKTCPSRAIAQP